MTGEGGKKTEFARRASLTPTSPASREGKALTTSGETLSFYRRVSCDCHMRAICSRRRQSGRSRHRIASWVSSIVTDGQDESAKTEPGPGGRQGALPLADRIIAGLNRLVGWIHLSRRRQLAVYAIGGFAAAALVVGLRFGSDLRALPASLAAFLARAQQGAPSPHEAPPPLPAAPVEDALAKFPREMVAELTRPLDEADVAFGRRFAIEPERLCASLAAMGLAGARMKANPLAPSEWACDSDIVPFGSAAATVVPSSIFASLRGTRSGQVDVLRLKLNLTDPKTADAAKSAMIRVLQAIHAELAWDLPPAVADAVRRVRDVHLARFGVTYDVRREWSDPPRLNIIITVDGEIGIMPTAAFAGTLSILRPEPPAPRKPGPARLPDIGAIEAGLGQPADAIR